MTCDLFSPPVCPQKVVSRHALRASLKTGVRLQIFALTTQSNCEVSANSPLPASTLLHASPAVSTIGLNP